jgi:hypothetical protein
VLHDALPQLLAFDADGEAFTPTARLIGIERDQR